MRTFVKLRQILCMDKELNYKLNELERKIENYDKEIQTIFDVIRQLMALPEKPKKRIGFIKELKKRYNIKNKDVLMPA